MVASVRRVVDWRVFKFYCQLLSLYRICEISGRGQRQENKQFSDLKIPQGFYLRENRSKVNFFIFYFLNGGLALKK